MDIVIIVCMNDIMIEINIDVISKYSFTVIVVKYAQTIINSFDLPSTTF